MTLAKEKLGRDIMEQETRDYVEGKLTLPDEELDIISGGANFATGAETIEEGSRSQCG